MRRRLTGTPLLAASGLALAVGCGSNHEPVGNLMAPPQVTGKLCVEGAPEGSRISINDVPATGPCTELTGEPGMPLNVEVVPPEGLPFRKQVPLAATMAPVTYQQEPTLPPVGNLMAPPQRP